MVGQEVSLRTEPSYSDAAKSIADHFNIPARTARVWKHRIGEINTLKRCIGVNGPPEYLEFICRRERLLSQQRSIEVSWTDPLITWYVKRAKRGEPRISTDQRRRHKHALRYFMPRYDNDWINVTRELHNTEKQLIEIYRADLSQKSKGLNIDFKHKSQKIRELKQTFPYLRMNAQLLANVVDSTKEYVKDFRYSQDHGDVLTSLSKVQRKSILSRDGQECLKCGSEDNLEVHHIIPRSSGGNHAAENLATLCKDCHLQAHSELNLSSDESVQDTGQNQSQKKFWEVWLD